MNLERALEVLKKVNSVCPQCKSKGVVLKEGNTLPCDYCDSKGYKTFEELINETEETLKPQKPRKKRQR